MIKVSIIDIIKINKLVSKSYLLKEGLSSIYSSINYYNSIELKISSIIRSLIKNHYFNDGNKRTALVVFYLLSLENNISINRSKNYSSIFIDIATNSYDVNSIKNLLFK